jgi:hypothetical protein
MVIVLVRDLMFVGRITATAKAEDAEIKLVRDPASLVGVDVQATRLVADLNLPGAIEAAVSWKGAAAGREVVGFVSHVDADTISRARSSGIDQVMARSRFVEVLPALLKA